MEFIQAMKKNLHRKENWESKKTGKKGPPKGVREAAILLRQNESKEDSALIEDDQNGEKSRIVEENIRLKQQIFDISQELELIMSSNRVPPPQDNIREDADAADTSIREEMEQRERQKEISIIKGKVLAVRKQLGEIYDNRRMTNMEDERRRLKLELAQLDDQRQGLLRIKQQQDKYCRFVLTQEENSEISEQLHKELRQLKESIRATNEQAIQAERTLRKLHEQLVTKQEKLKDLQRQRQMTIINHKQKQNEPNPQTITVQMVSNLEEEVANLEQERRESDRLWQEKIRAVDAEYSQKKRQQEKKLLILKQKQRQLRLDVLKVKELRKLGRLTGCQASESKKVNQLDMSQFRLKRNIKYLDK